MVRLEVAVQRPVRTAAQTAQATAGAATDTAHAAVATTHNPTHPLSGVIRRAESVGAILASHPMEVSARPGGLSSGVQFVTTRRDDRLEETERHVFRVE